MSLGGSFTAKMPTRQALFYAIVGGLTDGELNDRSGLGNGCVDVDVRIGVVNS